MFAGLYFADCCEIIECERMQRITATFFCPLHDIFCEPLKFLSGVNSKAVDLYNSATRTWSTAQLSVARRFLAAVSVGNLALFAGGHTGGT